MARGKLILICQSGGKFVTNDDESLTYIEGDARALDIRGETMFEDLKLDLAEMFNLDFDTLSIKYFIPQNRKTLITLSNDKDLKRMVDFHEDLVTADVFLFGKEGFKPNANSVKKKSTKVINQIPGSEPIHSPDTSNFSPNTTTDDSNSEELTSTEHLIVTATPITSTPIVMDMDSTPADTVKRRRRIASVSQNITEDQENASRKKRSQKQKYVFTKKMDIVPFKFEIDTEDGSLKNMICSWKNSIHGVDQDFKSVVEFRDTLQKYAVAHRFTYKLKKNEASRVSGKCAVEDCPWRIYASWVPSAEVFRIKKMVKSHTCGGQSWKSVHPAKKWLVSIIKDRLKDSPNHKPKEIARSISRDFGIELKYSQVWRGVEEAKQQLQSSYRESYNQLPWLCEKIMETNPGSVAKIITNNEKRFQCLFVSFHASIHGFQNGCRPLIFLESMLLKSKYQEILLIAFGVDGNDGITPIAFAIVDNENEQNWHWFLEELKSAVSNERCLTFVSDREKALEKSVLEIFENAHHGYSMYHLLESFKNNLKGPFYGDGRNALPGSFLAAAHASRIDEFKRFTEQVKQVSSSAYDWIVEIEPESYTSFVFKGEPYNHFLVNIAEPYLKLFDETRELPIIQKIESLRSMMVDLIDKGKISLSNWPINTKLSPIKELQLQEETIKSIGLKVLFSSDTLFEVHGDSINVVNIDKWDCSCLGWKITGIPCCHAIAVFNCKGMNVYDYCSKYFTYDSFYSTYSEVIYPLPAYEKLEVKDENTPELLEVLPPFINGKRKREKVKKERIVKRVVYCTKCKESGHNKATCKVTSS